MHSFRLWVESGASRERSIGIKDRAIEVSREMLSNPISLDSQKILAILRTLSVAREKLVLRRENDLVSEITDFITSDPILHIYFSLLSGKETPWLNFLLPPLNMTRDQAKKLLPIADFISWNDRKKHEKSAWMSEKLKKILKRAYQPNSEDDAEEMPPPLPEKDYLLEPWA